MSTPPAMELTDAFLDAKRLRGDATADEVAARLVRDGAMGAVDALFESLQRNDQAVPDGLPSYVTTFFDEGARLPDWASPEMIAEGQRVFERYGPLVLTLLLFRSLPMCYAAWPGVKVVRAGGKLARGPRRRALETTRFVMDVMSGAG